MGQDVSDKRIIAERISILDLVSSYVQLKQAGKYYKGLCPFHPDKNPSFVVNPERNSFYCFGCGEGGDIYTFFMKFHNLSFPQALEELARRAGVELRRGPRRRAPGEEEEFRAAAEITRAACGFYHRLLLESREGEAARRYLEARGIDRGTVSAYALGYAPDEWDRLRRFLEKTPGALKRAETLGLLIPRKSGRGLYDRFRNRLMFPIFNTTGRVLGFGGRALGEENPKYLNSPDSFFYHKGSVLYGLQRAEKAIRERGEVLLVEGYFDLLALHQGGIPNAVAVCGTALTPGQIDLLKRYTRNLVLVFDGDEAGRKAAFRNLPAFLERDIPARVVHLPEEEDPDSFVRAHGAGALLELVKSAPLLLDLFLAEKLGSLAGGDPLERKIAVLRELLPMIRRIPDPIEQGFRIRSVAEKVGVSELFLREELSKQQDRRSGRARTPEVSAAPSSGERDPWPAEERLVCQVLLQFPSLLPTFMEMRVLGSFRSSSLREVIEAFGRHYEERGTVDLPEILSEDPESPLSRLLANLSCRAEFTEAQARKALEDSARRIKTRSLKERLDLLNRRIEEAEKSRRPDLQSELSLEKQRLLEERKALLC